MKRFWKGITAVFHVVVLDLGAFYLIAPAGGAGIAVGFGMTAFAVRKTDAEHWAFYDP